jgi:hypothetical protein
LSSSTRLTSTPNWRWPPLGTRDHAIIIITIADSGKIRGKQKNKKTDILIGASWRARVRILRSAIRNNKTTKKKVEKNQRVQSISKIKFVNRFLFFSLGEKSHALDWALARIAHLKINKVASSISNEIQCVVFFSAGFSTSSKGKNFNQKWTSRSSLNKSTLLFFFPRRPRTHFGIIDWATSRRQPLAGLERELPKVPISCCSTTLEPKRFDRHASHIRRNRQKRWRKDNTTKKIK